MATVGKHNDLTDVAGIMVGHFTDTAAASGVTVAICSEGAVTGVDVRGAAPGTRETDLLAPQNLVQHAQAVVLAGGSVFGLAAADGVVRWLAKKGFGLPLDKGHVAPIVPAAVLYDLGRGLYPGFRYHHRRAGGCQFGWFGHRPGDRTPLGDRPASWIGVWPTGQTSRHTAAAI